MVAMNKLKSLIGVALIVFVESCSDNRVFEEFHSFKSNSWYENDSVVFDLKKLLGRS
jgi:hypothetical protein